MKTQTTIIALKLRGGRRLAEVFALAKILFVLFLMIAAIAGAKAALCKLDTPHKTFWECVLPQRGSK
jgi:hypothetical protein